AQPSLVRGPRRQTVSTRRSLPRSSVASDKPQGDPAPRVVALLISAEQSSDPVVLRSARRFCGRSGFGHGTELLGRAHRGATAGLRRGSRSGLSASVILGSGHRFGDGQRGGRRDWSETGCRLLLGFWRAVAARAGDQPDYDAEAHDDGERDPPAAWGPAAKLCDLAESDGIERSASDDRG